MKRLFDEKIVIDPDAIRMPGRLEGAVELIELAGRRPPMIGNRLSGTLDKIFGFLGNIVGDGVSKVSTLLADIIKIPTDLIGSGVELVLLNFAGIVSGIPIIGDFVATILTAANALIQFAIKLPETLLRQVATLGEAFKTLSAEQKAKSFTAALSLIKSNSPPEISPQVVAAAKTVPAQYGVQVEGGTLDWVGGLAAAALPVAFGLVLG